MQSGIVLNRPIFTKELTHDDNIKWKRFPRYWSFVRGIHRFPHKGQWRGPVMFSLISAWINGSVNNREAGDLRRHGAYYDVTVMRSVIISAMSICRWVISQIFHEFIIELLREFHLLFVLYWWSSQATNMYMQRQLGCRDLCKIVT